MAILFRKTIPDAMEKTGACNGGRNIDQNSGCVSEDGCYVEEDFLRHGIIRINIEHINRSECIAGQVDPCSEKTAEKIQQDAVEEAL